MAWNYGALTERWIGNWLTKRGADGTVMLQALHRDQGEPRRRRERASTRAKKVHGYDGDRGWSCRKSIERMNCGYIDLYQIHWPSRDTPPCHSRSARG